MTMFRPALVLVSVGFGIAGAQPAMACGMHGSGFHGLHYNYNPDGMSYLQQLEAEREALRRFKRERDAELERARTAFAARFKVDPVPSSTPEDQAEKPSIVQQSSSSALPTERTLALGS